MVLLVVIDAICLTVARDGNRTRRERDSKIEDGDLSQMTSLGRLARCDSVSDEE